MLRATGVQYSAERARQALLEPRNGEHVWITVVAYRLSAEQARAAHRQADNPIHLDMENIASVSTGCFICEQPYTERESYRKCKGEPSD